MRFTTQWSAAFRVKPFKAAVIIKWLYINKCIIYEFAPDSDY